MATQDKCAGGHSDGGPVAVCAMWEKFDAVEFHHMVNIMCGHRGGKCRDAWIVTYNPFNIYLPYCKAV